MVTAETQKPLTATRLFGAREFKRCYKDRIFTAPFLLLYFKINFEKMWNNFFSLKEKVRSAHPYIVNDIIMLYENSSQYAYTYCRPFINKEGSLNREV